MILHQAVFLAILLTNLADEISDDDLWDLLVKEGAIKSVDEAPLDDPTDVDLWDLFVKQGGIKSYVEAPLDDPINPTFGPSTLGPSTLGPSTTQSILVKTTEASLDDQDELEPTSQPTNQTTEASLDDQDELEPTNQPTNQPTNCNSYQSCLEMDWKIRLPSGYRLTTHNPGGRHITRSETCGLQRFKGRFPCDKSTNRNYGCVESSFLHAGLGHCWRSCSMSEEPGCRSYMNYQSYGNCFTSESSDTDALQVCVEHKDCERANAARQRCSACGKRLDAASCCVRPPSWKGSINGGVCSNRKLVGCGSKNLCWIQCAHGSLNRCFVKDGNRSVSCAKDTDCVRAQIALYPFKYVCPKRDCCVAPLDWREGFCQDERMVGCGWNNLCWRQCQHRTSTRCNPVREDNTFFQCDRALEEMVKGAASCSSSTKLDLQIIVDSSGSVGEVDFNFMMKKISDTLISQFEIGQDKTRVALTKFSTNVVNEFSLSKYSEKSDLQTRIKSTKFETGWSYTARAMEEALTTFVKEQREDATKVCMVFTDGQDQVRSDHDQVPAATTKWANNGATVYAIGIGYGISDIDLTAIAGNHSRVLHAANYKALGDVAKTLLEIVCQPENGGRVNACAKMNVANAKCPVPGPFNACGTESC